MPAGALPAAHLCTDPAALRAYQFARLRAMLATLRGANSFYTAKFAAAGVSDQTVAGLRDPADLAALPLTTKAELVADQAAHPPYGTNLTYPLTGYSRLHQTSGTTTGRPLCWLDTPQSWAWLLDTWATMIAHMGLRAGEDRAFFPFSFGPFLGFWGAFEAFARAGIMAIAGGGLSTVARLGLLLTHRATIVCATPTYALRLAEVARHEGLNLPDSPVRVVLVAGEPGGHIPATRGAIERAWGARVLDHAGMTELGPTCFEHPLTPEDLTVNETDFLAEVIDPATTAPLPDGATGELVLTNLGRWGSPLVRYRTGDLVQLQRQPPPPPAPCWARLTGGILARADDMIFVRGNNLYPTAIEAVVRAVPGVAEFAIRVWPDGPTNHVAVDIEPHGDLSAPAIAELTAQLGTALQGAFAFRIPVRVCASGHLPRFELKARRVVRLASPPADAPALHGD